MRLVDLNKYLGALTGATLADKNDVTEFNEIFFNIMPNIWSKQAYVQGLDYESISFLKAVNI